MGVAAAAVDVRGDERAADVEHEVGAGGVRVGDVVVVLVPPQLGQAEHLLAPCHLAQHLVRARQLSREVDKGEAPGRSKY